MDFMEMPTIQKRGNSVHVSHGDDTSCIVIFEMEWLGDEEASVEKGMRVGRQVPYVEIRFPGDKTKIVRRPVTDEDKQRWPRQWEHFEKTGKPSLEGFPIEDVPSFTRGDVQMFKSNGIATLEQLAAIEDGNLPGMWRKYRDTARAMIKTAKDTKVATKLEKENSDLRAQIDDLKEQVAKLATIAAESKK